MLLQMFAAVVVGGTTLGGGRGGPLGTVFGAYILMMVVNILLVLNVSAYYSTIAEGSILILAVLAGSTAAGFAARPPHPPRRVCALRARLQGRLPGQRARRPRFLRLPARRRSRRATRAPTPGILVRNAETLRFALPAYVCFALVVIVTQFDARPRADELVLLQFADRAVLVPRRARARAGRGDPDRRPRSLGALDDRPLRHPARRHGEGLGRGARLRAAARAARRRLPSASSTAPASSCSASRRS